MAKLINEFPAINNPIDDDHLLLAKPDNVTYKLSLAMARDFFERHISRNLQDLKNQVQGLVTSAVGSTSKLDRLSSAFTDYAQRFTSLVERFYDLKRELQQTAQKVEINANGGSQDARARTLIDDLTYKLKILEDGVSGALQVKSSSFSLAQNGTHDINTAYEVIGIYERVAGINVAPANMTSNSTPSPYVARNATNNANAYLVFDGATNTGFDAQVIPGDYIQIDLGASYVIESYAIAPRYANPRYWDIEGSLNGSTWFTVQSDSKTSGWTDNVFEVFSLDSLATLRYFRLKDTEGSGSGWSIAELRVFGTGYWQRAASPDYQITCNNETGLQTFSIKKLSSGSIDVLVRYL